jgi:LPS-assembly lipoprotein
MSLASARFCKADRARSRTGSAARSGVAAVLVTALLLTACGDGSTGFRPMYGTASIGGSNVSEKLAAVEIAPVPGRVGQRLRNEMLFQTTGGGGPAVPAYRLEVAIKESITSTLVKISGDASGSVYNLDADFRLIRIADKQVVLQGKSAGRAGFERFQSIFSNVRARQDAENRVANTVAQDLKTRLAAYLSGAA